MKYCFTILRCVIFMGRDLIAPTVHSKINTSIACKDTKCVMRLFTYSSKFSTYRINHLKLLHVGNNNLSQSKIVQYIYERST